MNRVDSSNRLRLFVFWLFAAIYFLSFLQRVAVSVVADDLAIDLGLDGVALGFMSSVFFVAYAITQPVMGKLADAMTARGTDILVAKRITRKGFS